MTVMIIAVMLFYYFIDPSAPGFPIKCPSKLLTGYDCPSCGSQRALHALMHGDFVGAIKFNLFLVIGIPYLLLAIIAGYIRRPWAVWISRHVVTPLMAYIYIALFFAWWILRNTILA